MLAAASGALFALSNVAQWPRRFRDLLTTAAAGTLGPRLATRYEFELVRVLSFRQHLSLGFAQAVTLLARGLFELAATLLTEQHEMAD